MGKSKHTLQVYLALRHMLLSIPPYRQGHLSMVIHLMRYGALPEVADSEGLNCLHIAAQFGFTSIVGYLISCRTPVVREFPHPYTFAVTLSTFRMFA